MSGYSGGSTFFNYGYSPSFAPSSIYGVVNRSGVNGTTGSFQTAQPASSYGVNINLGNFLTSAFGFGAGATGTSAGFNGSGLVQQQNMALSAMSAANQVDQAFITRTGQQAQNLVLPVVLNTNSVLGNVAQQEAAGLVSAANTAASNTGGGGGLLGGIFGGIL